jgi:hypothetical protein
MALGLSIGNLGPSLGCFWLSSGQGTSSAFCNPVDGSTLDLFS